ncbi:fibronectin type III domain-containing protein, partial [Formosa sp. S-31]|uniref:fibronectin type III domain-containing protein n=1 Tax=Formosa sp. S-31 TaxID=2790949 RepID=UPI003EBBEEE4
MKIYVFFLLFFTITWSYSQNLHDVSNAASISNESNSTVGWNGGATISSSTDNPFGGNFSLRLQANALNNRDRNFTFNAIVGEQYTISIWAREGDFSLRPAFANWTGFNGFQTTVISGQNWTEYTWTLTATNTSPLIRIYTAPISGWEVGHEVFFDNVDIRLVDEENPSIPTGLNETDLTATGLTLNWNASTDNIAVTDYEVFQDGASLGLTAGATSLAISGLASETVYEFTVEALDGSGNRSGQSNSLSVGTLAAPDTESPTIPDGLAASVLTF